MAEDVEIISPLLQPAILSKKCLSHRRLASKPEFTPSTSTPASLADTSAPSFKVYDASNNASSKSHLSDLGLFERDQANRYHLTWANYSKFEAWFQEEQSSKTIEFVRKEIQRNPEPAASRNWIEQHVYVCGRGYSGGKIPYHNLQEVCLRAQGTSQEDRMHIM